MLLTVILLIELSKRTYIHSHSDTGIGNAYEEGLWPSCTGPLSADGGVVDEGSCRSTAFAGSGNGVVVKGLAEEVERGRHTLSVSLVPDVSSPWAWQIVWVRHFSELESEKVPLVHGLHTTSSVSLPRLLTLVPGGHSEWGLHSVPPAPDRKLLVGHVQTRSWVGLQVAFSTKPPGHGPRQGWHFCSPFSPRVKVPSGQRLHSLTAEREQWSDTWVPAGHLSQSSWVPESGSVCWYCRGERRAGSAGLVVFKTRAEMPTTTEQKS